LIITIYRIEQGLEQAHWDDDIHLDSKTYELVGSICGTMNSLWCSYDTKDYNGDFVFIKKNGGGAKRDLHTWTTFNNSPIEPNMGAFSCVFLYKQKI
jgi:hypothetical protein